MQSAEPADGRAVRVSTLELFFDLVFVFTVTQLTVLLADEPDAAGLVKVVLLLSVIWWMYDGYAWLTNALALDVLAHRLLLIGGMAGFLIMALAAGLARARQRVGSGPGFVLVVLAIGWFVSFYPLLSALPIASDHLNRLLWFGKWI